MKIFAHVLILNAYDLGMMLPRWKSTDEEEFFNKHHRQDLKYLKMVELVVEDEFNLYVNKFDERKNRNLGFSSKMEEKTLIRDKFIVFRYFERWCLISEQAWKVRDGWNLFYVFSLVSSIHNKNMIIFNNNNKNNNNNNNNNNNIYLFIYLFNVEIIQ